MPNNELDTIDPQMMYLTLKKIAANFFILLFNMNWSYRKNNSTDLSDFSIHFYQTSQCILYSAKLSEESVWNNKKQLDWKFNKY